MPPRCTQCRSTSKFSAGRHPAHDVEDPLAVELRQVDVVVVVAQRDALGREPLGGRLALGGPLLAGLLRDHRGERHHADAREPGAEPLRVGRRSCRSAPRGCRRWRSGPALSATESAPTSMPSSASRRARGRRCSPRPSGSATPRRPAGPARRSAAARATCPASATWSLQHHHLDTEHRHVSSSSSNLPSAAMRLFSSAR